MSMESSQFAQETSPEEELSMMDEAIQIDLKVLQSGYEDEGGMKPWPAHEVQKSIEGMVGFLNRKKTIYTKLGNTASAEDMTTKISELEGVQADLVPGEPVKPEVLKSIRSILK